nr:hypothetical protein [Burkholderiales bacterium]
MKSIVGVAINLNSKTLLFRLAIYILISIVIASCGNNSTSSTNSTANSQVNGGLNVVALVGNIATIPLTNESSGNNYAVLPVTNSFTEDLALDSVQLT